MPTLTWESRGRRLDGKGKKVVPQTLLKVPFLPLLLHWLGLVGGGVQQPWWVGVSDNPFRLVHCWEVLFSKHHILPAHPQHKRTGSLTLNVDSRLRVSVLFTDFTLVRQSLTWGRTKQLQHQPHLAAVQGNWWLGCLCPPPSPAKGKWSYPRQIVLLHFLLQQVGRLLLVGLVRLQVASSFFWTKGGTASESHCRKLGRAASLLCAHEVIPVCLRENLGTDFPCEQGHLPYGKFLSRNLLSSASPL